MDKPSLLPDESDKDESSLDEDDDDDDEDDEDEEPDDEDDELDDDPDESLFDDNDDSSSDELKLLLLVCLINDKLLTGFLSSIWLLLLVAMLVWVKFNCSFLFVVSSSSLNVKSKLINEKKNYVY